MIKTSFKGMEDTWIVKNNKLVEAQMNFSANEYKFITFVTGQINRETDKFDVIEIKVNDLKEHCFKLKKTTKGMYSYIKKYAYSMAKKNITIQKEGNDIIIYNWFDKVETERGIIKVCFSSKMEKFLLNNKNNFTAYKLSNILNLDTFYQMRLYEILKQYEKLGVREVDLKTLRFMLGIEEPKIKRFADFKEHVLNKSIKKINDTTDIKTTYDFIKASTNIMLKFGIIGKNTIHKSKELSEIKEKIENVIKEKVHLAMLEGAIKSNKIKKSEIEMYLDNWHKFSYKDKDDPVAFFIWIVSNRKPIPNKQNGINKPEQSMNFDQRDMSDKDDEYWDSHYENFK